MALINELSNFGAVIKRSMTAVEAFGTISKMAFWTLVRMTAKFILFLYYVFTFLANFGSSAM